MMNVTRKSDFTVNLPRDFKELTHRVIVNVCERKGY